jgi:ABC-type dipeptide/oligopeptide/nickel transport system permease component
MGTGISLIGITRRNHALDAAINAANALAISMPGFFLGILLIWIFGIALKLFIPGAYTDYRTDYFGFLGSLFFPALAIAIPNAALLAKFLRTSIKKELALDYVRAARSKGLTKRQTLLRHVIKNACLPALTLMGMIIGEIFGGSIVIEQVFTIPGIGRLLLTSISSRDYPLIETLMVYIAFIVILGNTAADIASRVIDPRIADAKVRGEGH